MLCSCSILYALRCWKVISFTAVEPQSTTYNPLTLVPLKTLIHTLPLAIAYLLYMVRILWYTIFHNLFLGESLNISSKYPHYLSFLLKAGHDGSCARHKCSHVHHPQADHSGFYDDCGVSIDRAETLTSCCWQVHYVFDFLLMIKPLLLLEVGKIHPLFQYCPWGSAECFLDSY